VLTDLRGFDRTGLVYDRGRTAMGNGLASAAHQDHRRQRLSCSPPSGTRTCADTWP
jgi:pentalenene oxygenase